MIDNEKVILPGIVSWLAKKGILSITLIIVFVFLVICFLPYRTKLKINVIDSPQTEIITLLTTEGIDTTKFFIVAQTDYEIPESRRNGTIILSKTSGGSIAISCQITLLGKENEKNLIALQPHKSNKIILLEPEQINISTIFIEQNVFSKLFL